MLTIVAASDIHLGETVKHLREARKVFPNCDVKLFTSKEIRRHNSELEIVKISPLNSLKAYSDFIIYQLHKHVNSLHVMIVQWDGFIINPSHWDNRFLEYDYIGAPFIPRSNDWGYSRDRQGRFFSVGNGGFSIRSKKLLEAPSMLGLLDEPRLTNNHEDGFFCVLHRATLVDQGFRWAPTEWAFRFAIESPLELRDLLLPAFGIHGRRALFLYKLGVIHITKVFKIAQRWKVFFSKIPKK